MSIPSLKKTADKIFSKYIRLRDAIRTTGSKLLAECITCDKVINIKTQTDAGHWMGRGAGGTRYDEHNVHAQCKGCNKYGGAKMVETYRRKIIELYGEDEVERIYIASKRTHNFTTEELENIIKEYTEKYESLLAYPTSGLRNGGTNT